MCLNYSQEATTALQQGEWPIKAYKFLKWDFHGHFLSPYQSCFEWQAGINKSDRGTELELGTEISRGIHVFLVREQAERSLYCDQVVVEVVCQEDHFVAAGSDNGTDVRSAVFTEVFITDEEYARALEAAAKLIPDDDDEDWEDEEEDWDEDEEDEEDWEDEYDEEDWDEDDWDWEDDEEDWEDEDEEDDEDWE